MKILIDLTSLFDHLTGIERFSLNMAENILKRHTEDEYVLLFKNEVHSAFRGFAEKRNVRCIVLKCKNRLLFNQLVLPAALYRNRCDVCFFPAFPAPWLFFSKNTVNIINDMSDFECFEGKGIFRTAYSRLGYLHAKHCSRNIVTVSAFSRGRIAEILNVPAEKIDVVHCGISVVFGCRGDGDGKWREKYGIPEKYLLSLSTVEPRKNLRLLIEAYRELRGETDAELVLCGRMGWNLKKSLGGDADMKNIHVTGFVDDDDLPYIYQNARAFVFPSKYEGFGMPPLEAMKAGCPVISSDASSMPEILGDAAVFFESGSRASLKKAMLNVLAMDENGRKDLIERGLARTEKFKWENEAEKLYSILAGEPLRGHGKSEGISE